MPFVIAFLQPYQKLRILTFFNPDKDPLGAGYQIIQSKIAIGSGGLFGKGFLLGSQSRLYYLPEKRADFSLSTPNITDVAIVDPEREIPGKIARA